MRLKTAIIISAGIIGVAIILPIIMGNAEQAGRNLIIAVVLCLIALGMGTLDEYNLTKDKKGEPP